MADEVLFEVTDQVAVIKINRPHARNAVNRTVALLMAEAMDELDRRDDLAVGIVTGVGGAFSAGMDLKAFVAGERAVLEGRGFAGLTGLPSGPPDDRWRGEPVP